MGGWLTEDPIGFAAGDTNLWRYVNNSPTSSTDPTGLEIIFAGPGRDVMIRMWEEVKKRAEGELKDTIRRMEDAKKRLKINVVSDDLQVAIAWYDDDDYRIDLSDVMRFRGTVISPEAVVLHEVVEKWQKLQRHPPKYSVAHAMALIAEGQLEGYTRTGEISTPSTPWSPTGAYVWTIKKDGKTYNVRIIVKNGNLVFTDQWEVMDPD